MKEGAEIEPHPGSQAMKLLTRAEMIKRIKLAKKKNENQVIEWVTQNFPEDGSINEQALHGKLKNASEQEQQIIQELLSVLDSSETKEEDEKQEKQESFHFDSHSRSASVDSSFEDVDDDYRKDNPQDYNPQ